MVDDHMIAKREPLRGSSGSDSARATVKEALEPPIVSLLIAADIGGCRMEGFEVMRHVLDRTAWRIALTASATTKTSAAAARGFETHLIKPVNFQTLQPPSERGAVKW